MQLIKLIKLVANELNARKIDSFYCFTNWHNKIPGVGRLGGIAPTTFWRWGRLLPWSRRLWL